MPTAIALNHTQNSLARGFVERTLFYADLAAVCLWSALGLALTAAAFAVGFAGELGPALVIAG
jgi:hypothetical protein